MGSSSNPEHSEGSLPVLNGNVGQERTHSNIYKEIEGRVL
jgi:hypothetical protein